MQTLYLHTPNRVRTFLIAGLTALVVLALLAPALVFAQVREGPPSHAPSPPVLTIADVDAIDGDDIVIKWSVPQNTGAPITGYDVQSWVEDATMWDDLTGDNVNEVLREAFISGPAPDKQYWARVRAKNGANDEDAGPWSERSQGITPMAALTVPDGPEASTIVVARAAAKAQSGELIVTWGNVSTATSYRVQYRYSGGGPYTSSQERILPNSNGDMSEELTLSGLINGKTYHVQVRAENNAGVSDWAVGENEASASAVPTTEPGIPGNLALIINDVGALVATWDEPSETGGLPVSYLPRYRSVTAMGWLPATLTAQLGREYEIVATALAADQSYEVQVRAQIDDPNRLNETDVFMSDWSASVTIALPPLSPSAYHVHDILAPTLLVCHTASDDHGDLDPAEGTECTGPPLKTGKPTLTIMDGALGVSWQAPAPGGQEITDYDINYRVAPADPMNDNGWRPWSHSTDARTATITGLTNGLQYDVRVRAGGVDDDTDVEVEVEGPWSDAAQASPAPANHEHGDVICHDNAAGHGHGGGTHIGTTCTPPAPTPEPTPAPSPTPTTTTSTVTRTVTRTVFRDAPAPAPTPVPQPAIIGDSGYATAYLAIDRQSVELRVHPQAGGPASHTYAVGSYIRDADLGQTYQIVAGGKRRWVGPNSPLVYAIPWASVNSQHTYPTNVVAALPLDESAPPDGFLVRGMNGRIVSYSAGMWRHVPNIATFQALGYRWCDVNAADGEFFSRISEGIGHAPTSQPVQANYPSCGS